MGSERDPTGSVERCFAEIVSRLRLVAIYGRDPCGIQRDPRGSVRTLPIVYPLRSVGGGGLEIRSKIRHRLARRWPIIASNYKGVLGSDDDDDVDDVDDDEDDDDDDDDDDDGDGDGDDDDDDDERRSLSHWLRPPGQGLG